MGSVVQFKRNDLRPFKCNGLSAKHLEQLALQLRAVSIIPECAEDGALFAIIDDDKGAALEVCLIDGNFTAGRAGLIFARSECFDDIIFALNREIDECS